MLVPEPTHRRPGTRLQRFRLTPPRLLEEEEAGAVAVGRQHGESGFRSKLTCRAEGALSSSASPQPATSHLEYVPYVLCIDFPEGYRTTVPPHQTATDPKIIGGPIGKTGCPIWWEI